MFFMGLIGLMGNTAVAQESAIEDSLRLEHMQEVVVSGVRAQKDAPFAVTNIRRQRRACPAEGCRGPRSEVRNLD